MAAFTILYYPVMTSSILITGLGSFVILIFFQLIFQLFHFYIPSSNMIGALLITYLVFTGYRLAIQENLQWRALKQAQAARHWAKAVAGTLDGVADFTEGLQASAWIHRACASAVDRCYTLGGGAALFDASPLQRRLRDIHAVTQHFMGQERFYTLAGAKRLGFPPVNPITGQ